MKAATGGGNHTVKIGSISIHAAREGGDSAVALYKRSCRISIHAAREGGDVANFVPPVKASIFQSTPPVKAATSISKYSKYASNISIHAAREGGDTHEILVSPSGGYFNPRRP